MKILTWNINGIRATSIPLKELLDSLDADLICLQETKVTRDQLEEKCAVVEGYNSYFSFSNARSGYSGTAIFVRDDATPIKAEEGLSGLLSKTDEDKLIGNYGDQTNFTEDELRALDNEGRTVITQHQFLDKDGQMQTLTVINVYCPRADPEREDRKSFKLRFYELLQIRAEAILQSGSHVIVLGDVNTSHRPIDHCDPANDKEFKAHLGRQWLDRFLYSPPPPGEDDKTNMENTADDTTVPSTDASSQTSLVNHDSSSQKENNITGDQPQDLDTSDSKLDGKRNEEKHGQFIDTFRYFHPAERNAFTCWNTSTGSRQFNYGTRIDYVFTDRELCEAYGKDCTIHPDIQGSDHCPVKLTLTQDWAPVNHKCPPLCTKYMPEFAGRQQKLSAFLVKGMKPKSDTETSGAAQQSGVPSDSQGRCSDVISSTQSGIKRSASNPMTNCSKKPKLTTKSSSAKQQTLASFFTKKATLPKTTVPEVTPPVTVSSDPHMDRKTDLNDDLDLEDIEKKCEAKSQVTSQWKSLFKGPKPPPLCRGHKEPCVLRTVKKDNLNKGRQFYTCARAEGPKSNPETRCEHFEWVDKKKKS